LKKIQRKSWTWESLTESEGMKINGEWWNTVYGLVAEVILSQRKWSKWCGSNVPRKHITFSAGRSIIFCKVIQTPAACYAAEAHYILIRPVVNSIPCLYGSMQQSTRTSVCQILMGNNITNTYQFPSTKYTRVPRRKTVEPKVLFILYHIQNDRIRSEVHLVGHVHYQPRTLLYSIIKCKYKNMV
jgi:hypothetical protein